ncbi:hypothetical protein UFOVP1229_116 [uncultured Caudovirales phage]|uniref:Uncharacterized protein n=1 Tax=uncultured Caudovirales phage TaxID=2100421 RepID=A0A6J5RE25_9CAUD|nr:hypothetical protein UFOVP1229_116 [uncultured Caudovirales phage]
MFASRGFTFSRTMTDMKVTKDIIRAADYRPNPHNRDFVVPVTVETLDHWADTFNQMKTAGIGVPVPWEHPPATDPHTNPIEWSKRRDGDPRNNAGWVESIYRDGDTLMAVLDVPDECGESLVKHGCYVSPKFGGTWNDSLDRKWVNPIHHIALTTKPVAVNQSREFKPVDATLAFSRAMCFSTTEWDESSEWSQPGDDEMPDTPEVSEAIQRLLENPDVLAAAAEKLRMTHEFSATFAPNPGAPGGIPNAQPDPYAAAPEQEPDGDEGNDTNALAICMQVLHAVNQASAEGMKALAKMHGVNVGDDDDGDDDSQYAPPPAAPAAPVTATPAVVSMSRDDEHEFSREEFDHLRVLNAAMANKLTRLEQAGLVARAESLFDAGRCTRPDVDALKNRIGKYEFSRQSDSDNVLLLRELEIYEKLPEGSAVKSPESSTQFSRPSTSGRDESFLSDGEGISDERADEILANEYRLAKKPA